MPEHHPDREDLEFFHAGSRKWSGNPNAALVREARPLRAGTALDIGCGEGADVDLRCAGVGEFVPGQPFDLVTCSHLPVGSDAAATVEQLVAPGATLLRVHHDSGPPGRPGTVPPTQVAELLGAEFTAHKPEAVDRGVTHGAGAHHTRDAVLVAVRAG